jgi:DNA-binding GntR family transcriptional regulator
MPTIAAQIYRSLAEQIIAGTLAPGQKLEEKVLAERFGVSRTPIREALRELGARGLIELVPRRGGVVARIGLDEVADMLEAECEIEALCARLAAQRMSAVEKKQLERVHQESDEHVGRGDVLAYLAVNKQFHDLVCAGTHSRTIARMVRGLRDRLAPFRQAQSGVERRLEVSHEEHAAVVRAILDSDADAAYGAMRDHNARLGAHVLERLRAARADRTGASAAQPAPAPAFQST